MAEAWGFGNARVEFKEIVIQNKKYTSLVWAQRFEKDLKFDSDWKWLMEAVEFINKNKHKHKLINPAQNQCRDLHYTIGYLLNGGWWGDTKVPRRLFSDITQLFLAVSDFAKLFNDKKL